MAARLPAARRLALAGVLALSPLTAIATDVGEAAPGFELPSANTASQSLPELLQQGPVVVVFYRAFW